MDIIQGNENNNIILKLLLGEDQDSSYQNIMLLWNGETQVPHNLYVTGVLLIFSEFSQQLFCKLIMDGKYLFYITAPDFNLLIHVA